MENKAATTLSLIFRKLFTMIATSFFALLVLYLSTEFDISGYHLADKEGQMFIENMKWMFLLYLGVLALGFLLFVVTPLSFISDWITAKQGAKKRWISFLLHIGGNLLLVLGMGYFELYEWLYLFTSCLLSSILYWWLNNWLARFYEKKLKQLEEQAA